MSPLQDQFVTSCVRDVNCNEIELQLLYDIGRQSSTVIETTVN